MKCLLPITITSAMLTSSVADVDTGETAWVSGTTYALADVRTYNKRKYERLVAGAGTTTPDLDVTNWLDVGPTNKWAMFDTLRNTGTTAPATITVTIVPGQRVTAIALMRCAATSATLTVSVGGIPQYTVSKNMLARNPITWTEYFFGGFKYQKDWVVFDVPPYSAATITVTLTNSTEAVSIGALCMGMPTYIGQAQYSAVSSALNFSTISRDTFGNTTLLPRRSVPKTDQICFAEKSTVNALLDLRSDSNAIPCVWSWLDDKSTDGYFAAGLILGIYKEFSINVAHPTHALVTLQLEEV